MSSLSTPADPASKSSSKRSSSGVRNLRAFFEDREETLRQDRGRSPSSTGSGSGANSSANGSKENLAPYYPATRKVRSSFISVNPRGRVNMEQSVHSAGSSGRRPSFSVTDASDPSVTDLKKVVSDEKTRRESIPEIKEAVPEQAAGLPTPIGEVSEPTTPALGLGSLEHTEKPTTSAEDAEADLRPSDPKDTGAVSKGQAVTGASKLKAKASAAVEKVKPPPRASLAGSKNGSKPAASSNGGPTKLSDKALSVTERLASHAKPSRQSTDSQASNTSPPKATRSAPLSAHIMAPTAASIARHEQKTKETGPTASSSTKRTTTSASIPSRLTAPTAASAAHRNDKVPETKPAASRPRASLAGSGKPSSTRTSLAAQDSKAKPTAGDFLARMTKPTASSKAHEKQEADSSDVKPNPVVKAANGLAKKAPPSKATTKPDSTDKAPPSAPAPAAKPERTTEKTIEKPAEKIAKLEPAASLKAIVPQKVESEPTPAAAEKAVEEKPEPKVEQAPAAIEAKSEPKSEPKIESKPEPKAEAKKETKKEIKPEVKAEPTPEAKPDVKPEVKPDVKPEPKVEEAKAAKVESKQETKAEKQEPKVEGLKESKHAEDKVAKADDPVVAPTSAKPASEDLLELLPEKPTVEKPAALKEATTSETVKPATEKAPVTPIKLSETPVTEEKKPLEAPKEETKEADKKKVEAEAKADVLTETPRFDGDEIR